MIYFATNIKLLREQKKLTQKELAAVLEIKPSRLGSYEESRAEPPFSLLQNMAGHFGLTIDSLINVDLTQTQASSLVKIGDKRLLFPVMVDTNNNDLVEIVPVKASAGYLNGYADPEYITELPKMNLPFMPAGKHRAFPIKGDSMPPLKDGSFVVGRFVESLDMVKDGKTYVLITNEEGIVYKRVYSKVNEEGRLHLVSDNQSYEPYSVNASDVLELWEFACHINLGEYQPEELNLNSILSMFKELKIEIESIKKSRSDSN